MKNRDKNKGFTLAEMLIVVAIIAILVAIITVSIVNSLEKAREATDMANIRSAMSELADAFLDDGGMYIKRVTITQKDYKTWLTTKSSVLKIGEVNVDLKTIVTNESDSKKKHLVPYINVLIDSEGNIFVAPNGKSAPKGKYFDLDLKKYDFDGFVE